MVRDVESEELRYFQALEEAFIRLRGAPLLLSPADWQVAQRWRSRGIPLDFAIASLAELFARRRDRGVEDRVSSLRYCARAVESAWKRAEELAGPVRRAPATAFDAKSRLRSLADAVPQGWPRADGLVEQILALEGDAARIEAQLASLDDRMLAVAGARLTAAESAELDAWVAARLEPLAERFAPDDVARAAARLRLREMRRRAGLPLLSLFSLDAERLKEEGGE